MSLFCFFSPQNSFPRPSGSNPGFFPFPGGLRWIDRDLRLRTTGVPPLNRGKSLQSSVSTSVCRPRYQGQTQGFHLRGGFGRLGGIWYFRSPPGFWDSWNFDCFFLMKTRNADDDNQRQQTICNNNQRRQLTVMTISNDNQRWRWSATTINGDDN